MNALGRMLPPIALSPINMPRWHEVHVWWFALTDPAPQIELTLEERQRALRFESAEDLRRFVSGRSFLNAVCAAYAGNDPRTRTVVYDRVGRPHVSDGDLYCSASHSGALILVGVAKRPVGVDVEEIRPGKLDDLMTCALLGGQQSRRRAGAEESALAEWTKREAIAKARGTEVELRAHGRGPLLSTKAAVIDGLWRSFVAPSPDGYVASVACRGAFWRIRTMRNAR